LIKTEQLQTIIDLNKRIHDEISKEVERDLQEYSQHGVNISETIALKLSEMCELIQLPIKDDRIGGMIIRKNSDYYCLINTEQPRAFQNFVYLHEFYHLLHGPEKFHVISGNVEDEIEIEERKANYYASLMLLNKNALRTNYYYFIKDRQFDLKTTIYYLMNLFKTTYKTILIRLYEIGCIEDFSVLYENFNNSDDMYSSFDKHGLDKSIIEPSRTISIGKLDHYIKIAEETGSMLEDFIDLNKKQYYEIMEEIRKIQEM